MATVDDYRFPADRWYDPREHLWVLPEPVDDGGTIVLRARERIALPRGATAPPGRPERGGAWGAPGAPQVLRVGIDELAARALGEVVYVEIAPADRPVRRGDGMGSLEAEKMVRPLLAPVSGTILEVNDAVVATPRLLGSDPYGAGWLFRVRATDWTLERDQLLVGDDVVAAWARSELERAAREP